MDTAAVEVTGKVLIWDRITIAAVTIKTGITGKGGKEGKVDVLMVRVRVKARHKDQINPNIMIDQAEVVQQAVVATEEEAAVAAVVAAAMALHKTITVFDQSIKHIGKLFNFKNTNSNPNLPFYSSKKLSIQK